MEGLFVSPGSVEVGQGIGRMCSTREEQSLSGNPPESDVTDFGQLLEESIKKVEEGFWGTPLFAVRSCSNWSTASNPCSFSSTLAEPCSLSETFPPGINLSSVRENIAQFLEDLEGISFALDLGKKGTVKIEGMRNQNGEFSFQIQGSKDVLADFFTMLFGYLAAIAREDKKVQSGWSNCAFSSVNNSYGSAETCLPIDGNTGTSVAGIDESNAIPTVSFFPEIEEMNFVEETSLEGKEDAVPKISEIFVPETHVEHAQDPEKESLEVLGSEVEELQDTKSTTRTVDRKETLMISPAEVSVKPDANVGSSEGRTVVTSNVDSTVEIEKIFDHILQFASREQGPKEVVIKLHPESLGSILVRLREDTHHLQCVWEVADAQTRELIQKSLPLLEARLQGEGFVFQNFWGGGQEGETSWQHAPRWARGALSEVLGVSEEQGQAVWESYRVNFLA